MTEALFNALRDNVADGEVGQALEELRNLLSAQHRLGGNTTTFREFENDAILQLSRLKRAEKSRRRGVVDDQSSDRAIAQISSAVLDLLDDAERLLRRSDRLPVKQIPIDLPAREPALLEKVWNTLVKVDQPDVAISISAWGRLTGETAKLPQLGDHVTIIQHPNSGLKQIGLTANEVVNIFGSPLHYMTDTLPGSRVLRCSMTTGR